MPPLDIAPDALDNPEQYATLDHITPLSKGGTSKIANLQLTHMKCNGDKGDSLEVDKKA
jgi:5-methylcytosine-specific restriction endonuclease McrA